jgi:glycine hydroxymethyltransferase
MNDLKQILNLTRGHNRYVRNRVDLIASNSWISQFVRLAMSSSLVNNYCIGLPGQRLYGGCSYIDMMEREVMRLARQIFGMKQVVVQFLSGMQANIGAYNAILRPGDTVVSAPGRHGGHYSHGESGPLRFFAPRILPMPFDDRRYTIDVPALARLMERERPRLLILGWSEFPFPHPLAEIRALCDATGTRLMYDMSHVAGLVAGKVFQPDAARYADIITSSTGKSLHAPDHGMVLFDDPALQAGVNEAVMPLLTSNTHPHELAALGVALAEVARYGGEYATAVVKNSKALARALAERGFDVLYADLGYTESHTVLVRVPAPDAAVSLLDRTGILCNACQLPWDEGTATSGLRLGTQVVTRRGMREAQMEVIAGAMAAVLLDMEDPDHVEYTTIHALAEQFDRAVFSFDFHFPLEDDWYQTPYQQFELDDATQIVRELTAFADLATEDVQRVIAVSDLLRVDGERVLVEAAARAQHVCFVDRGQVDLVDPAGAVHASIVEGSHFGDAEVLGERPHRHAARARAGSRVILIRANDFRELLDRFPAVAKHFVAPAG